MTTSARLLPGRLGLHLAALCLLFCPRLLPAQIFVGNHSGSISAYSTSGTLLNASFITGLYWPRALAYDNGYLYTLDIDGFGAPRAVVGKYTLSGTQVSASLLSGPQHIYPLALALDGQKHLYVSLSDGTVWAYDTQGQPLHASPIVTLNPNPVGLAVGPNGNLYASSGNGRLTEFTPNGLIVNDWNFSLLGYPGGLVVENGFIYVLAQSGDISQFTTAGTIVNPSLVTGLLDPRGIASDGQGHLFIADGFPNRVSLYTTTGQTLNANFITAGLEYPTAIVVVPEPSTPTLITLGLAAWTLLSRRTRPARLSAAR